MSQKSAYAVWAVLPLLDMFFQLRPMGMWSTILHAAICGAAIYYVVKNLKPFGFLNLVMTIVAVVYNPFREFALGTPGWLTADIVVMALFYLLARKTALPDDGGVKHYASEEEYEKSRK